jgi:phosphatidylserine/phosphatidylglycerophosphate/cardiolipin synthase-like enzyme
MTRAAFGRNREYMAVLTDPTEVADLAAIFEADWHRVEHLPTAERLVVAPTNARDRLGELIRTAERSLDVEAEVLSDSATIRLLGEAAARGVAVRLVMSPDEFSQAGRAALARAGVQVRLLSDPFMHAKMILADGRRLYVGSVNLSAASLDRNREVGVILTERPVIQLAQRTFERDWSEARPSAER